ncbi:hypothetical protein M9Y10_040561 [Tritrichomonas musculus]|uniref:Protein kinase domain-containing protein n=1 Tax=Tritrichomonas musculus TaxID=1915356 RepID=A0ABR2GQT5_9EUKA
MESSDQIDLTRFQKIEKIGHGSFFKIYKILNRETNQIYAAKISLVEEDISNNNILQKYQLISRLNYPTIIKYFGYSSTDFKQSPKTTIITEYLANDSLSHIISLEREHQAPLFWNSTKKLKVIYGIASGMSYLHSCDILHRDLNPSNILLDEQFNPKISGFTLAIPSDEINNQNGVAGTMSYIAPEVLIRNEYTKKGDVYAFAITAYEILTGQIPYENQNLYKIILQVTKDDIRPTFPDSLPISAQNFIIRCWSTDQDERPTFDEIVNILKENPTSIINDDQFDQNEFFEYVHSLENAQ